MSQRSDSVRWLRERVGARPHVAKAHVHAAHPVKYRDADAASAVVDGERVWLFRTAEARDVFVRTVRGAERLEELPGCQGLGQ